MSFNTDHRGYLGAAVVMVLLLTISAVQASEAPLSGVIPAKGALTAQELRAIVIEVRGQLRYHHHVVAVQKAVRDAAVAAGIHGAPTLDQIRTTSASLNALHLFIPIVVGSEADGFELVLIKYSANDPSEVSAEKAKLPPRSGAYTGAQVKPAVAATVAALLNASPDPAVSGYPEVAPENPMAVLVLNPLPLDAASGGTAPPVSSATPSVAASQPPATSGAPSTTPDTGTPLPKEKVEQTSTPPNAPGEPTPAPEGSKDPPAASSAEETAGPPAPGEEKTDGEAGESDAGAGDNQKKSKGKWDKWYHQGLFGELGVVFSWCRRNGMCATPDHGYGVRLRLGIRIMSMVALSITGVAVDHQMPLTTDFEKFTSVSGAFFYGAFFGGIRFHPIRRFLVDPYIGIDVGKMWLFYAGSHEVEPDPLVTPWVGEDSLDTLSREREIIYLNGPAVAPEMGVNVFATPSLAFGMHVQWLIPIWREACVRVIEPGINALKGTKQVCSKMDKLSQAETMDEDWREKLSNKDNVPRFVSLELDLTLLFK